MSLKRIAAILGVYLLTCVAWLTLGGLTHGRSTEQRLGLREQVASLWGEAHTQRAPDLFFRAVVPSTREAAGSVVLDEEEARALSIPVPRPPEPKKPLSTMTQEERKEWEQELERLRAIWVEKPEAMSVSLASSTMTANLRADPRRKGLVWYSLYDVDFTGDYVYRHTRPEAGYLDLNLSLPTSDAIYDGLIFRVNGEDQRAALDPAGGGFGVTLRVRPGDEVRFSAAYQSRGADEWRYDPGPGVQRLDDFRLAMHTDFSIIDFPTQTLSPTEKDRTETGWDLVWDFGSTLTGHGMGMVLPSHIQPGELSSELSFSAPISLLFFFVMLFVVATLRGIEIHPINYLFLAAAFFAFHLLFSYSVDHLTVTSAFVASSAVSLALVVSYLRLVVSRQFAYREAALGQLVYLVGFSLAHFWEGYTGLTVTVLAIVTLFILMQVTGRLKWAEVLASPPKDSRQKPEPPVGPDAASA